MNKKSVDPNTFAKRYQSVLVPVIFEPWAKELVRRAAPQDGEHILDLACGTGVVTREIVYSGIKPGDLTAVDHNADMLGVARELSIQAGFDAEWVEADAGDLPFDDGQFDAKTISVTSANTSTNRCFPSSGTEVRIDQQSPSGGIIDRHG